ncbi:MAG: hypothetical protein AAF773_11750 [Cyanobacteria bacterium P01_D01_bin.115]
MQGRYPQESVISTPQIFNRNPLLLAALKYILYVFGGLLMVANIFYTYQGLTSIGWVNHTALVASVLMGALESAIAVILTSPGTFAEMWEAVQVRIEGQDVETPTLFGAIMLTFVVGVIILFAAGCYLFDFWSTFIGLYSEYVTDNPVDVLRYPFRAISVCFMIFGTEVAAFFGYQCGRLAKRSRLGDERERAIVDPELHKAKKRRQAAMWMAEQQAEDEVQDQAKAYAQRRSNNRPQRRVRL